MAKSLSTDRFVAELCRNSYYQFLREFWSTIIAEKFHDAWYIRKLCDELQVLSERVFADEPKEYDLIWNCPPGTSKPVWEGSRVMMADGSWKKLRNVSVGDLVIGKSGKACRVSEVHVQGKLSCVRITTSAGRKLVAAPDHPVLTADGWVEAGHLLPGQVLALMHRPWITASDAHKNDEFSIAGYLIGDGSVTDNNCSLTNADPDYLDHFRGCVDRMGFDCSVTIKKSKTQIDLVRIALKRKKGNAYGPRNWLREVGIAGKSSYTKCVPDFVWKGSNEQISEFLAAYFHCDGHVSYRDVGKRNIVVSMTTVSKGLAIGLQRLLLRLGISMRLRVHVNKNGFKYNRDLVGYTTYRVETTDQDACVRFMEAVPLRGRKKQKLIEFQPQRRTFDQEYWPDFVKTIETIGKNDCRCLTVEGDSSFCVEGIIVHNSSIVSIFWQPWIWTRMPSARYISGSYSERLALDHSRKSRDVVLSEKYQRMFPNVCLRDDQNTKGYFANTSGGIRYAVGVGGTVIGMHAHFIGIDDPVDPQAVLSDLILADANVWMTESLSRRKVNLMLTPTALIMQRLHQNDPTGSFLERGTPVKHCCLPADATWDIKPPEFKDFYEDGLLDPIRLPQPALDEALKTLLEYGYAGQYGQCLTAGTLVQTESGSVPIQCVSTGDRVFDRNGKLRRVLWSGETKRIDDLTSVLFSNGSALSGTADHPVWTENRGFCSLAGLNGRDYNRGFAYPTEVLRWEGRDCPIQKSFGSRDSTTCVAPDRGISDTEKPETGDIFTGISGSSTTEISPLVTTSITKTKTQVTIESRIWSALLSQSICEGICGHSDLRRISDYLRNTVILGSKVFANTGNLLSTQLVLVSAAGEIISRDILELQCTALEDAEISAGFEYFQKGNVSYVRNALFQAIRELRLALRSVLQSTDGVPVYDLSVEDSHEFFANGILVHNSPVPRGGAMFKIENLSHRETPPIKWKRGPLRYWDKAATPKAGAFTVGVKGGVDMDDRIWILHVVRGQWDSGTRERKILDTARMDGKTVKQVVEQEPAGAGKESAESTVKRITMAGYRCSMDRVSGDKEMRADPFSEHVNMGNVILLNGVWNKEYVDEMKYFPRSRYKDQIDASSGLFNSLVKRRFKIGAL